MAKISLDTLAHTKQTNLYFIFNYRTSQTLLIGIVDFRGNSEPM